jgi:predicted nuclease of restriction endonuclease-like RecB superfamily
MLTGKLVRVRVVKNELHPQYLNPQASEWLRVAEEMLPLFRSATGRTRAELEEAVADILGEGPGQLIPAGFAKLLEDRCEFEVAADFPPEQIRETVFRLSAAQRSQGGTFPREQIVRHAAEELQLTPAQVESGLFADLKDEQRVVSFEDLSAERLVHRYNVALAQAILIKATHVEIHVAGETPARFRQLFRAVRFHRLICTIEKGRADGYQLVLDGPMSLFSSTQKYGLQLALFLPHLLLCKQFSLRARVRWGAQRVDKNFSLDSSEGLKSHLADFGVHVPREVELLMASFRDSVKDWLLSEEPNPLLLGSTIWVPDFTLKHRLSGNEVHVEVVGFWRKTNLEELHQRLQRHLAGKFLLVVSEQYRADESDELSLATGIYRYKRTPIASEVAKLASAVTGGS